MNEMKLFFALVLSYQLSCTPITLLSVANHFWGCDTEFGGKVVHVKGREGVTGLNRFINKWVLWGLGGLDGKLGQEVI